LREIRVCALDFKRDRILVGNTVNLYPLFRFRLFTCWCPIFSAWLTCTRYNSHNIVSARWFNIPSPLKASLSWPRLPYLWSTPRKRSRLSDQPANMQEHMPFNAILLSFQYSLATRIPPERLAVRPVRYMTEPFPCCISLVLPHLSSNSGLPELTG
jgi:hypothetical protein